MIHEYLFTPGGLIRLRSRIVSVRAAYRAICDDNPAALESGDTSGWHDNFAYEENQRQMHQLARRVRDLEQVLARVRVVPLAPPGRERVCVGSGVRLRFEGETEPRTYLIAGHDDGDPERGRISYNSPLGRGLMGAEAGELRELHVQGGSKNILVLDTGVAMDCDMDEQEGSPCAAG